MIRFMSSLGMALTLLGLVGCSSQIHYIVSPADEATLAACFAPTATTAPEQIVGIALSGGGSRAAVFGAASMEALWEHGLIDLATHYSSVSGGSFASSYFIANNPSCDALASDSESEACWRQFFGEFKLTMRDNFASAMIGRQVSKFRLYSNSRMSTSLMDVVDDKYLHGMTFGDLAERDSRAIVAGRKAPVLLINGASYDDGRRFVFSNLCLHDTPAPAKNDIVGNPLTMEAVSSASFSRPGCIRPAPQDMPVSLAVATSAAFPGAMGPVTIRVPSTCEGGSPEYWHLGDGGLFDNKGVDTIEEVILREHRAETSVLNRALILSIDSGARDNADELRKIEDFWVLTFHKGRLFEAYNRRAQGYHDLLWDKLRGDLAEQGLQVENIDIRYTSAKIDRWPDSCEQAATAADQSPEQIQTAISAEIAEIETWLSIPGCHADLLEVAAHNVVHTQFDVETINRLRETGYSIRETPVSH